MRNVNFFRSMTLSLLLAGIGLVFTACSDDNDEPSKVDNPETGVTLDADTVQVFEGLTVNFQMLDKDNQPVTTFKEGEDITFKLVVTNDRDQAVGIPGTIDLLGANVFHVYSEQGEDLGLPWDTRIGLGLGNLVAQPGQSYMFLCDAFGEQEDVTKINPDQYTGPSWCLFFKTEKARHPLPKGKYYTQFEINLNNGGENPSLGYKGVLCRKDFRIE